MFAIWTTKLTKYHKKHVSMAAFLHHSTPAGPAFQFLRLDFLTESWITTMQRHHDCYGPQTHDHNLKHTMIHTSQETWICNSIQCYSLSIGHVLQFLQSNAKSICKVFSVIVYRMIINSKSRAIFLTTSSSQHHNPYQIKTRDTHLSIRPKHTFSFLVKTPKSGHEIFVTNFCIIVIDLKRTAFMEWRMKHMHHTLHHVTTRFNSLSVHLWHVLQIFL